jgi:acetyl esterase/lipase
MQRSLDPEIASVFSEVGERFGDLPVPARGDWKGVRELSATVWPYWAARAPVQHDVRITTHALTRGDGAVIELRWYEKAGHRPGSAVVYAHGGGMISFGADDYDFVVSAYVEETGVPFLSVDYRLAPEIQGTALAEEIFSGLEWLATHASACGVDPSRIAVMGDSGGGGLAAGAAILARDRQFPLALQILVYPMLDDRNVVPDPALVPTAMWTYDNNYTAWRAMLGDAMGTEAVSPVAAPIRLSDFTGLAPAYLEVGDLDIFRDEILKYAHALSRAVPVELHVHPGAPHGFDIFAPDAAVTLRAMSDRCRVIRSL